MSEYGDQRTKRWLPAVVLLLCGLLVVLNLRLPLTAGDPPVIRMVSHDPPLLGFTFSQHSLPTNPGDAPGSLDRLMELIHPDVVRLPAYWDQLAPSPNSFNTIELDLLFQTMAAYNARHPERPAKVILIVGARNVTWPEVHVPGWISSDFNDPLPPLLKKPEYTQYLTQTFRKYSVSPLLYGWQIENEPLDNISQYNQKVALPRSFLESELKLLRSIDTVHPAVVTTFNSATLDLDLQGESPLHVITDLLPGAKPAGHPWQALTLGDALGLDLYVVTPSTPRAEAQPIKRIDWKRQAIEFWARSASLQGKKLWLTELQATGWPGSDAFEPDDLVASAHAYANQGADLVLFWGVEYWLDSPDWMAAGRKAIAIFRGQPNPEPVQSSRPS